jgi:hypothetical protein
MGSGKRIKRYRKLTVIITDTPNSDMVTTLLLTTPFYDNGRLFSTVHASLENRKMYISYYAAGLPDPDALSIAWIWIRPRMQSRMRILPVHSTSKTIKSVAHP